MAVREARGRDADDEGTDLPAFLTPWRLRWYPLAFLLALSVAFLIGLATGRGASTLTGRLGGDYPAFYCAGDFVARGEGAALYDLARQAECQRDLFPGEGGVFMPYSYPPFVAAAYAPLSSLPYRVSYTLQTLLQVAALVLAIALLHPIHRIVRQHGLAVFCVALSFFPMFRSIFGAQNTAATLLLLVLSWRATLAGRDLIAGAILGLSLFKPQFGIPLVGLLVLSGRWRAGIGSVATALGLYGVSVLVSGRNWGSDWFRTAAWIVGENALTNSYNEVSWVGFLQALLGTGHPLALGIGWALAGATALAVAVAWAVGRRRADPTAQFAITVPALLLLSPHVNYYDLGLLLFPFLAFFGTNASRPWALLAALWVFGFTQPLGPCMGVSPLFVASASSLAISFALLGRRAGWPGRTSTR